MNDFDDTWEEAPPKKRGLPRWVWFTCGCGSLLALLGAVGLMILSYTVMRDSQDPDVQWPRVEEALGFEERPDIELETGMKVPLTPLETYQLWDHELDVVALFYVSDEPGLLGEYLREDPSSTVVFGLGTPVGAQAGEMELRGRTVPILSFESIKGQSIKPGYEAGIRIDLGRVKEKFVVAELRKRSKTSEEDVRSFFEPFTLWSD